MPGMNGIEVTKRIRARYDRKTVVIIASAYDHSEVDEPAREAGADRFVTKPLFQSTLFDLLMTLSGGEFAKSDPAAVSYTHLPRPRAGIHRRPPRAAEPYPHA